MPECQKGMNSKIGASFIRWCSAFVFQPMRLLRIAIVLAVLVLIPFFIWGDKFMAMFDGTAARDWIKNYGPLGWLAVIGLLVSDLFLPIPATAVMSAAGYLYGA